MQLIVIGGAMASHTQNYAIQVKNAHKSYGTREVLKNLTMEVPRGAIYGLLGSSGCGKTTLLTCILGLKKLNSGELWVVGGAPGTDESGVPGPKVGYMPQEIALVSEFTITDTLYFFGRIYNMSEKAIDQRFGELTTLLELPEGDRMVKNCSGGQQRRLSFAVSIMQLPELMILDEPTVGVDPLLRERIWDYLIDITEKKLTSVVITTHYIEEARQANMVGLMRDGRLLIEDAPNQLLHDFQMDSLEEVFLALCMKQENNELADLNTNNRNRQIIGTIPVEHNNSTMTLQGSKDNLIKPTEKSSIFPKNSRKLKALAMKNVKQFFRNPGVSVFTLMLPIVQIALFLLAVGQHVKDIPLGIVNDESMDAFCPNFTLNGTAVPHDYDCDFENLGCRFLWNLTDPMITKVGYSSKLEALEDAKRGKIIGVLYIPQNFSESLQERVHTPRPTADVLEFSEFKVWLDLSNRQIGESVKYKLLSIYQAFQTNITIECKFNPRIVKYFDLRYLHGGEDDPFTTFMIPGILITLMFFIATQMTSQIITGDRCEGIWERTIIAGVSSSDIIFTHIIFQALIVIVHTIEGFVMIFLVFQNESNGNMWVLSLISYLQGIAGMSFGFWISSICTTVAMSTLLVTGLFLILILLSGTMWPIEGMPLILRWFSYCLPNAISIESYRNVMVKGWPIANFWVYTGIIIPLVWVVIFISASIYFLKKKR